MNVRPASRPNFWNLLKKAAGEWSDNQALRLSAALAYYSVFSIAPLLVLSVGVAGWFFGADAVRGHLNEQLQSFVGAQPALAIQTMVQSTSEPHTSLLATVVGLVTLLLGASGVFGQLKDSLNTIWMVKPKPGLGWRAFVRERLLSFGMVLVIGFLLLVSFVLTTLMTAFSHWIVVIVKLPSWIWAGGAMLISFAVVMVLFALIFKVLPDVNIDWRHLWIGAAFTAVLFEAGKFGLAFYLGRESTSSSFGAAGSVVLLLLWVYYASCILLFGAEFTKVYAVADGASVEPTALAEAVTMATRAREGMEPVVGEGAQPPKESLPAIFGTPTTGQEALPLRPAFPRSAEEVLRYVREHMAAGLLAGLGVGVAVGLASRALERPANEPPAEKIKAAAKLLGSAGMLLLTRFGRDLAQRTVSKVAGGKMEWLHRWLRRT